MRVTTLMLALTLHLASARPTWAGSGLILADADRAAINHVIAAQIEAFRHDDGTAALQFAAPALQRQFGDGPHFLDIVRRGYPAVFRPQSFTFGALTSEEGSVHQTVNIIGPGGLPVTAIYDMEHEPDQSWRIAGCSMQKSDQIAL